MRTVSSEQFVDRMCTPGFAENAQVDIQSYKFGRGNRFKIEVGARDNPKSKWKWAVGLLSATESSQGSREAQNIRISEKIAQFFQSEKNTLVNSIVDRVQEGVDYTALLDTMRDNVQVLAKNLQKGLSNKGIFNILTSSAKVMKLLDEMPAMIGRSLAEEENKKSHVKTEKLLEKMSQSGFAKNNELQFLDSADGQFFYNHIIKRKGLSLWNLLTCGKTPGFSESYETVKKLEVLLGSSKKFLIKTGVERRKSSASTSINLKVIRNNVDCLLDSLDKSNMSKAQLEPIEKRIATLFEEIQTAVKNEYGAFIEEINHSLCDCMTRFVKRLPHKLYTNSKWCWPAPFDFAEATIAKTKTVSKNTWNSKCVRYGVRGPVSITKFTVWTVPKGVLSVGISGVYNLVSLGYNCCKAKEEEA